MAKKKLNIWQKTGLQAKPRGRGRPRTEYDTKIRFWIPSTGLTGKKKKQTIKRQTIRQKKIALSNLGGGGIGFVVGGTLGGLGGMVIGFPVGVVAGNVYGRYKAGGVVGRPRKKIIKKSKR